MFFAQRVVDWLAADFKKNEGIDLLKDKQALQRLTETAEKAKMELSSLTQTNIRYLRTCSALELHYSLVLSLSLLTGSVPSFQFAFHYSDCRWP